MRAGFAAVLALAACREALAGAHVRTSVFHDAQCGHRVNTHAMSSVGCASIGDGLFEHYSCVDGEVSIRAFTNEHCAGKPEGENSIPRGKCLPGVGTTFVSIECAPLPDGADVHPGPLSTDGAAKPSPSERAAAAESAAAAEEEQEEQEEEKEGEVDNLPYFPKEQQAMQRRLDREEEMMGVGSLPASTGSQGGDPTDVEESDGRETVARRSDTEIDKASLHATGIAGNAVEAAQDERAEAEAAVESVVEEIAGKDGDDGAADGTDAEVVELLRREEEQAQEAQGQEAQAQEAEGGTAATDGSGEEQAEEAGADEEGDALGDAEVLEKAEEEGVPEEVAAAEVERDAADAATAAGAPSYTVRRYGDDETCLGAEEHRFSLDPERCQGGQMLERKHDEVRISVWSSQESECEGAAALSETLPVGECAPTSKWGHVFVSVDEQVDVEMTMHSDDACASAPSKRLRFSTNACTTRGSASVKRVMRGNDVEDLFYRRSADCSGTPKVQEATPVGTCTAVDQGFVLLRRVPSA